MPKFSAFQDFTSFRFSSKKTHGEAIYRSMVASEIKAFDLTKGSYEESRIFATAMGLGRARYAIERAFNQYNPLKIVELLPPVEKDWSCVPNYNDGIVDRQNALAAKMKLPLGAKRSNMEALIRSVYGDDFIAYRTTLPSEVNTWPSNPWTGPGTFQKETSVTLPMYFRLISPVTKFGVNKVYYEPIHANDPARVLINEKLTIEIENLGNAEQIQVTAVGEDSKGLFFTADFIRGHGIGASVLYGTVPVWISTQRSVLIIVKSPAGLDRDKLRRMNEIMESVSRGVTSWAVVEPNPANPNHVGPYTLNQSRVGLTTIGEIPIFAPSVGVPSQSPPDPEFVVPSSGPIAGFEFAIYGNGFTGATSVKVGPSLLASITSTTDKKIVCTGPALGAGTYDVTVTTAAGSIILASALVYS